METTFSVSKNIIGKKMKSKLISAMTLLEEEVGTTPWALDSNNNELDLQLKPASEQANQEFLDGADDHQGGPLDKPLILRNLLNEEQIAEILERASEDGVWPRGLYKEDNKDANEDRESEVITTRSTVGKSTVLQEDLSEDLRLVPHHYAWTDGHVVLYMHNNNHWFVRTLREAWGTIRGGMEARSWMNGAIPELDLGFVSTRVEDDPYMNRVRTVELHHYGPGGGLTTPGHRDFGSELTISVLLSDLDLVSGGDFVTYDKGIPVAHKMNQGDAILFNSMSLHNISTITAGVRKSLVVELWPSHQHG